MKDRILNLCAIALVKVGIAYDGNVSPHGWYQPKRSNFKIKNKEEEKNEKVKH